MKEKKEIKQGNLNSRKNQVEERVWNVKFDFHFAKRSFIQQII